MTARADRKDIASASPLTAYGLPFRPAGLALFLLCLAGAGATFSFGVTSIASAWAEPEYSHGPLIPLLSAYLFLRQMRHEPPIAGPVGDRWTGFAVMAFGLALGIFGNLAQIPDIVYYAFIPWCWGLIMTCFGLRRGFLFWPPVLHLIFMLPLPNILYWKVSTSLQLVSSEIGVAFISMMGIPVFLDGVIIDLGVYKLHVAEACSGLRYLFPVLSFSYIFAVLYTGPTWHKAVLLVSAAPITVLMNAVRIGIIGVMVEHTGIEWVEGFTHFFEGWVIFMTCIAILFGLAIVMQRLSPDPKPLSETIDLDFEGLGDEVKRVFSIVPSAALAAATALALAVGLGWHFLPAPEPVKPERASFASFPTSFDGRPGAVSVLEPNIEKVLDATDYFSLSLPGDGGAPGTSLFMAYYASLTEGTGVHSPEVCLPGGGWEIAEIKPTTVQVDGPSGAQEVLVNRAIIQNGQFQQLAYYWFDRGGLHVTSDWELKFRAIADRALTGRNDGALVRLITPVGEDGMAAADARLTRLLGQVLPVLPAYLPLDDH